MCDAEAPVSVDVAPGEDVPGQPAELVVGQQVTVAHFAGTIRFIGETSFAPGRWVGVELEKPAGKNNGTVQDVTYFTCQPLHGIFVRETVVKPLEAPASRRSSRGSLASSDSEGPLPAAGADDEPPARERRRFGVSAEAAEAVQADWKPPFHAKEPAERQQLMEMVRTSHDSKLKMMFGGLPAETFGKVVDAMFLKTVAAGEKVIQLGDAGDYFYIVKSGQFDILAKPRPRAGGADGAKDKELVKVFEAGAGFAFGELALLYNAPRSATIAATVASEVWCLERTAFRKLVVRSFEEQFNEYVEFLKRCDIFHELSAEQIAALAEVLEEEDFEEDEAILEQGDRDNKMYILREGKAVACIKGDQGEVEVMQYTKGDFFGEIALLLGEPRKASVYAVGAATCLHITRDTFNRVLGPLRDFLQRNIGKYQQYQDAIAAAHTADLASPQSRPSTTSTRGRLSQGTPRTPADSLEVFDGATQASSKLTKIKRFRMRTIETVAEGNAAGSAADALAEPAPAEKAESADSADKGEPGSLKEKVARDFENPKLVVPSEHLAVSDSILQMFGGLRLGEKFTLDKTVVAWTKVVPTCDGLVDAYMWSAPSWTKGSTQIAVLCQKGQKSASDPTPNQDNYFVLHLGGLEIYGVFDGHGPFGHLVSFRLAQTVPHFLTTNEHFGKDWARALKEAFLAAQQDLLAFCGEQSVNVEASGAAGSVLVFEGPSIHVAHIGDAGAMVASWNRRDSRLIHGTKDHKPQVPDERARLEAAGSEVRELDEDNFRIYIRGTSFPGLTMSRAFGDTACAGVLQEPEYHNFFMQPGDEYYAIIASDGIWEFLDYAKVVDLTAKKLRLKGPSETVRFLTEASRKRWAYCCGEYCDDITCLLVQWNVKDKNSAQDTNHLLTINRHA